MEIADFYNTIHKRKSIRKYINESLAEKTLNKISSYMNKVTSLDDDIEIEMKIVSGKDVRNFLLIKAPYYILFFSEKKEGYLNNAGFMLQQVDLFLSANEIGSCWVGLAKPKKEIKERSNLEYVIAMAFGKPNDKIHRERKSEFKRKNIEQIRDGSGKDKIIEAVRLSPSATNSQPWFFKVVDDKIHIYCVEVNFIKAIFYRKLNKIDMGIAIYHLWIAARYFDEDPEMIFDEFAADNPPRGYYYISTLNLR